MFEAGKAVAGWRLLFVSGLLLTAPCVADGTAAPLPAEVLDRLRMGEVVLEERNPQQGGVDAGVWIYMHAPVERIWEVMVSCADARAYVAGLRHCEVLEERGDYALAHQVLDKGWTTPRLDYTFETRRVPYERMDFSLVDGNLKEMRGSWTFQPLGEGLLVRHELVLELLVPVPRWLVRRNILKDLPGMMRCVRALAGGSGSAEMARNDRAQCAVEPQ
jgi:ribosome-associated toxin RatA of RatAB toxin-antitoxin module